MTIVIFIIAIFILVINVVMFYWMRKSLKPIKKDGVTDATVENKIEKKGMQKRGNCRMFKKTLNKFVKKSAAYKALLKEKEELGKHCDDLNKECKSLQERVDEINKSLISLYESAKKRTKELESQLDDSRKQIEGLKSQLDDSQKQVEELNSQCEDLKKQMTAPSGESSLDMQTMPQSTMRSIAMQLSSVREEFRDYAECDLGALQKRVAACLMTIDSVSTKFDKATIATNGEEGE